MAEGRIEGLPAARLWAATRFPYLATGVFGAEVTADPGSGTVSVDEHWRMRADPELAAQWTPAQLGSVLIHHLCHLLRTHGERAQGAGVGPEESPTWIRAADAEINDDLVPAGLDLPGTPVLPQDLGSTDGLLAEQYFEGLRSLRRTPPPGTSGGRGGDTTDRSAQIEKKESAGGWLDCGSGADGVPRAGGGPGGGAARAGGRPGRPNCCGGRSRRTSSRTTSRPGPCRPGCFAGRRRCSARRSTGGRCSRPRWRGPRAGAAR